jgi:hypothetical protein
MGAGTSYLDTLYVAHPPCPDPHLSRCQVHNHTKWLTSSQGTAMVLSNWTICQIARKEKTAAFTYYMGKTTEQEIDQTIHPELHRRLMQKGSS